jgi:hypothetical protein
MIGNRPVAWPVYNGQGSELAMSLRPGMVRYEAAIPLSVGRIRPLYANEIGLSLQINDADHGQPKGVMRWAGGLTPIDANAQFGRAMLAPLSPAEIAQRKPVMDLLADAAVSWDLMRRVLNRDLALGDNAAATAEVKGFLQRHPQSYHAARALAWYEHLLQMSGAKDAAHLPAQLAEQLNVPALSRAEARTRLFVQVKLPHGRHPPALGLRFKLGGSRWDQGYSCGVYWGRDLGAFDENTLYMGPLPDADNAELSFPIELLELCNRSVEVLTFANLESTAWFGDLGLIDADGQRHIWVPADGTPSGKLYGGMNWASRPAPDGSPAHAANYPGPVWSEHFWSPVKTDGLSDANAELFARGGSLDQAKCLEAAWLVPDNKLAVDLLAAIADPQQCARFVRQFPASPQVSEVLLMIASRGGNPQLADAIVAEGKIPRPSARDFYNRLLGGMNAWKIVGPFSNEGDVAQRRTYEPEQRIDLEGAYRSGDQELRWTAAKPDEDGMVNFNKAIEHGEYQVAYAVTWARTEQSQRGWLFVESPNVLSAWLDSQQVMENVVGQAHGRRGGLIEPVPVTLKPGSNRLLVKVCNRTGYWGFRARLGNADGSPLSGVDVSAQPPAAASQPATAPER